MLDTLLEIGQKLRQSPAGLRHHRYIKKSPIGNWKTPIISYELLVADDYSFDFSQIHPLKDESRINALFYWRCSAADVLRHHVSKTKKNGSLETSGTDNSLMGDPKRRFNCKRGQRQREKGEGRTTRQWYRPQFWDASRR